ncbi:predicted protein [Methanosarcina acetivorans C2A]|uniref:Uncharacterized protein n=1 Tax=Methanosarcina acetivorans (strain ATCC 35395 / DSM 2834 / JCM 12185 / C2A) TaxID=188937 RepID=Q8TI48_METAC|nr:predicted protein [Methanosarcina acetivorans C2A]
MMSNIKILPKEYARFLIGAVFSNQYFFRILNAVIFCLIHGILKPNTSKPADPGSSKIREHKKQKKQNPTLIRHVDIII